MSTQTSSIFKSPEMEHQFLEVYEQILVKWNVSHEAMDISTRFGMTHINSCGSRENPALILLPGFGTNSTMWYPNIEALSRKFFVYALDTPGQPGKSRPTQTLTAANSQEWLVEVMDKLGLQKAHIGGLSLGGWLSLNFALYHPERINKLVLLDPAAALEPMSKAFFWHSLLPIMVFPTRPGLERYFRWISQGYKVDPLWGQLMRDGVLNLKPHAPIRATPFSDKQLSQLQVPTLLLIGGRSVIYNPERSIRRAIRLIPNLQAEIIPDASHALNMEKAELVNARILAFLKE